MRTNCNSRRPPPQAPFRALTVAHISSGSAVRSTPSCWVIDSSEGVGGAPDLAAACVAASIPSLGANPARAALDKHHTLTDQCEHRAKDDTGYSCEAGACVGVDDPGPVRTYTQRPQLRDLRAFGGFVPSFPVGQRLDPLHVCLYPSFLPTFANPYTKYNAQNKGMFSIINLERSFFVRPACCYKQ